MTDSTRPGGPLKRFLHRVGQFQSALLLTVVYGVVWLPAGIVARLFTDWLHVRRPTASHWWPRGDRLNNPIHVKDPF